MLKAGDRLQVKLTTLSYGGQALYKSKGIVLFVPKGLPEDIVNIKINKLKKNYGTAEIIDIVKPSPLRVIPKCKAFGEGCGGCQWLHFDYHSQLFWKTKIVREALKHIGRINVKVEPIIGMKNPVNYRNKLSLHRDNSGRTGLCMENSRIIIEFDECMQELPYNVEAYNILKQIKFRHKVSQIHIRCNMEGDIGLYFFCDNIDNSFIKTINELSKKVNRLKGVSINTYKKNLHLYGDEFILQQIEKIRYTIPHNSFFQTNYEQVSSLLKIVRDFTEPKSSDTIIDLYSGVGLIALYLARSCSKIIGIENNRDAIKAAKYNAKLNRINNADFSVCDAEIGLKRFKKANINTIILDPPRTGCEKKVISEILRIRPDKIVYVSCAPDTLSRDLALFMNNGYKVDLCQPIDMFPQTYHIETVVRLNLL